MRDFVPDDFLPEPDAVRGMHDGPDPGAEAIPDELVDAFFDGDLDDTDSREFIRELRNDAPTAKKVVSLNSALEALRRPVSTPDFTSSIMDEVEGRTPWLSGREFRLLGHWRAAAAIGVLCLITATFVTQRVAPGSTTFVAQDAPVTRLSETLPGAATGIGETINVSFDAAQQLVTTPHVQQSPCESQNWCFTTFSKEFLATGCATQAIACEDDRLADEAPACVDECGAVQVRSRHYGTVRLIGTPAILNVTDVQSGTIIIK